MTVWCDLNGEFFLDVPFFENIGQMGPLLVQQLPTKPAALAHQSASTPIDGKYNGLCCCIDTNILVPDHWYFGSGDSDKGLFINFRSCASSLQN